jgi:hypothetical protein
MSETRNTSAVLSFSLVVTGALLAAPAGADVITDWNQKAIPIVVAYSLSAPSYRDMAVVHVAMFTAVNSIEPMYRPYKATTFQADRTTSKEAAAAVAAARVLVKLHPDAAPKIDPELAQYLAQIPDGAPKSAGIALG